MVADVTNEISSFYVLLNFIPKITIVYFFTTACSGAERQNERPCQLGDLNLQPSGY